MTCVALLNNRHSLQQLEHKNDAALEQLQQRTLKNTALLEQSTRTGGTAHKHS